MKINTEQWKNFFINDLFEISLSKGDIKLKEMDSGDVPLVSAGESDNGIVGYISRDGDGIADIFKKGQITVDMFCHAFYQNQDFYSVSHGRVNILSPKFKMSELVALFICTLINKESYKYSYGRAVYSDEISRMEIKLPVLEDGHPNWRLIEDFMRKLLNKTVAASIEYFNRISECK